MRQYLTGTQKRGKRRGKRKRAIAWMDSTHNPCVQGQVTGRHKTAQAGSPGAHESGHPMLPRPACCHLHSWGKGRAELESWHPAQRCQTSCVSKGCWWGIGAGGAAQSPGWSFVGEMDEDAVSLQGSGSPGDARGILGLPYGDKKALSEREVWGNCFHTCGLKQRLPSIG